MDFKNRYQISLWVLIMKFCNHSAGFYSSRSNNYDHKSIFKKLPGYTLEDHSR